jgi:hypothetical protein
MLKLERAGVLHRIGSSARNRTWEAAGLLETVVKLEEGA